MLQKTPTHPSQPSTPHSQIPKVAGEDDLRAIAHPASHEGSSSNATVTTYPSLSADVAEPHSQPSSQGEFERSLDNSVRSNEVDDLPSVDADNLVQLAATSADELMDAVFEDVDYMLDKGVSLVPASPRHLVQKPTHPGISSATEAAIAPPPLSPLNPAPASAIDRPSPFSTEPLEEQCSVETERNQWPQAFSIAFPILGACATLGIALAMGFVLYGPSSSMRVAHVNGTSNGASVDASDASPNGDFADYMERALDAIATTRQSERLASTEPDSTPDFSSSPSPESTRSSDIPERVYIPVYQPPQPSLTPLPTIPVEGNLSTLSPAPLSSPLSHNAAPAPPPAETTPFGPSSSIPSSDGETSTNASTSNASSSPVLSELSHDHVLVGLLQLGDRSVAMFDFTDGTHRVSIGEQIGSSGWSLVSVSQNEAIIRRNGDVRSIYIGQSF